MKPNTVLRKKLFDSRILPVKRDSWFKFFDFFQTTNPSSEEGFTKIITYFEGRKWNGGCGSLLLQSLKFWKNMISTNADVFLIENIIIMFCDSISRYIFWIRITNPNFLGKSDVIRIANMNPKLFDSSPACSWNRPISLNSEVFLLLLFGVSAD